MEKKTSWEYRIMESKLNGFGIYEVYYDAEGKVNGYSSVSVSPRGETLDELREDFFRYAAAFNKPALVYED